jgi:hypothetical protein
MGVFATYCYLCSCPLTSYGVRGKDNHFTGKKNDSYYSWLDDVVVLTNKEPMIGGVYDDGGNIVFLKPGGKIFDEKTYEDFVELFGVDDDYSVIMKPNAVHHSCWQICGQPKLKDVETKKPNSDLEKCHGQDLDIDCVVEQKKQWMLVDPRASIKDAVANKERILKHFTKGTHNKSAPKKTIGKVVKKSTSKVSRGITKKRTTTTSIDSLTKKQLLSMLEKMTKQQLVELMELS